MKQKKKQSIKSYKQAQQTKTTDADKKQPKVIREKKWWAKAGVLIVLLITLISYYPAIDNQFVNWDDDWYVIENTQIRSLSFDNISDIFSGFYHGQYSPVTTLLLAVNYGISELSPLSYHLTGVILHLINVFLVFWFISLLVAQMNIGKRAGAKLIIPLITALLFGINTLQVESVAWVSAQKVSLYSLFFLASLVAYLRYTTEKRMMPFIAALFFFALSFGSKEQAMVLPVVLVGIDFFINRKLLNKKVIIEKIPFFALAIIFGIVSLLSQAKYGAISENQWFPFIERIPFAGYSFLAYFAKLLFPYELSGFYPYPVNVGQSAPAIYWLYALISLIVVGAVIYSLKKGKTIFFAILFYSINIFLTLQIVSTGREVIIADRYAYIPAIGLFFLIGAGIEKLYSSKNKMFLPAVAVLSVWVVYLAGYTFQRCDTWKDGITFWTDVQEKYPTVHVAFYNRGNEWLAQEKFDKAIADYKKAVPLKPTHAGTYSNMGVALAKSGKMKEALENYNKIIEIDSTNSEAYSNRGNSKAFLSDLNGALTDYNKAISLDSSYIDAFINRAVVRDSLGDWKGVIQDQTKVISMDGNSSLAYLQRGLAFSSLGRINEAKADFAIVLKMRPKIVAENIELARRNEAAGNVKLAIDLYTKAMIFAPNNGDLYFKRGTAYDAINEYSKALNDYNKAAELKPESQNIYVSRGVLKGKLGNLKEAIRDFDKAIELKPKVAASYSNRGLAKMRLRNVQAAISDYSKAIEFDPRFTTAYHNRALAYQQLNKTNDAISDYSKLIELNPKASFAFYQRGRLYLIQNKKNAACADFKKGTELGHEQSGIEYNQRCGK